VVLAGLGVRLARTWGGRRELPEGVWIPDEDDQQAIGIPLARIAARHAPLSGEDSADVGDGLGIVTGTAGYVIKNLQAEAAFAQPLEQPAEPVADPAAGQQ
jgi:hypothetical protein